MRPMQHAFTLIELLVVIAVLAVLAGMIGVPSGKAKARAQRISCLSNLKAVGFGYRAYAEEHGGSSPPQTVTNADGTQMPNSAAQIFRDLEFASNGFFSLKVFVCPADERSPGTNWSTLSIENISYFTVLNANPTNATMMLAGDRNLKRNGTLLNAGVFTCATNDNLGWTSNELHRDAGNVLLCDGSVQQLTSVKLTEIIRHSGTNHELSVP